MNGNGGRSDLPRISVIVPTRDRPELLKRALASILNQGYVGEIEVLVVFDQGDPHPIDVAAPGRRIAVLTNERTPGLAGARNTGILHATGDYVAHCDDDDEWHPEKLARQLAAFDVAPDAEVVVSGVTIVYEGRRIDRVPDGSHVTFEQLIRSRVQAIHPSSIVARRGAVVGGIGLVDEDLPGGYGEDYDWLLRASRRRPIVTVRAPLVQAHWHRSSYFADRWAVIAEALTYLLRKFPEFEGDRRGLARIYGQIAFAKAAIGDRSGARSWARRTLTLDPRERRAYLALVVSGGLVSADSVLQMAHRVGRGI
jgi:glycosyltransferase involved in cell wall biosynthesis